MDLSQLKTAKKISQELAEKFHKIHIRQDEAQRILGLAMEAAMTAAINVNCAIEVEHEALRELLEAEIGTASAGWAVDTKTGWAADRREVDMVAHRQRG